MPLPIKENHYLTQGYGLTPFARSATGQRIYKNFPNGIHPGLDFGTKGINHAVLSTCAGKVVASGLDGGWGIMVEVEGTDGWRRQYAHLQYTTVEKGEFVDVGAMLGRVGTTGASTGIHLHYGHRRRSSWKWEYRDPSFELEKVEEPVRITKKLIKSPTSSAVYIYTGRYKYPIPDWETKVFLFGNGSSDIEEIEQDRLEKIPLGTIIPSLI